MSQEQLEKSKVAQEEEAVLAFWNERDIFRKTLTKDAPKGDYVFYDGPPFATGLPHYGHLFQGTAKDIIPRYQTMRGFRVRRQWGWDCHGLPIENLIEKELGLKNKRDIENLGIDKFNAAARNSVLRYDADWKKIVPRMGRFVDMNESYKTMDWKYSESIWWAFSELYKKGLAYEGYKAMHICPRCETTLANAEVTLGYKEVKDITATVKFELRDEPGTYVLAWTTTPWTLPGNVALAVNKDVEYVKVSGKRYDKPGYSISNSAEFDQNKIPRTWFENYIIAKPLFEKIFKSHAGRVEIFEDPKIIETFKGSELIKKYPNGYNPPFDYYANDTTLENHANGWKIYAADFVTTDDGTGVVHIAPAFGEDDMALGKEKNLPFVQHVGMDGKFKPEVKDFAGMSVKPKSDDDKERLGTDIAVIKWLTEKGVLFSKENVKHPYPHCWRCDTPLLNYAASSWFIRVTSLKEKLLAANEGIHWIPEAVKHGRFGKWLEGARDWAISRSRFWGAPLPVWKCKSCEAVRVIGSVAELKEAHGKAKNSYFVMRHGESLSNTLHVMSSDPKNQHPLTETGRAQAREHAQKLADKKFDVIIASDFERTKETAEIAADVFGYPKEKIEFDARLREYNFGDHNLRPLAEYYAMFPTVGELFEKKFPGGETLYDTKRRLMEALMDYEKRFAGKRILIVSHDNSIWMLFAGAMGADKAAAIALKETVGDDFLVNGEIKELPYVPFPHNEEFELDVHRPHIDEVTFACAACGGEMRRIPDVFDCWFESGSMPYAQFHYPFENEALFNKNFPANFIAEALDQTRGWFYNMLVLSVGLFGKSAFKNVIVSGLILAEDGQKMSKKLKNYPDPMAVVNKYGADALRYYLLASPVVHAEDLNFTEKGVDEVFKKIILRLQNTYAFYALYEKERDENVLWRDSKNVLDKWIVARLSESIGAMTENMENYALDKAVWPIDDFINDFSTWYIRRSRERCKGDDAKDKSFALATMQYVLKQLSIVMAPAMPFIAESMYQKVKDADGCESVHLENWPDVVAADAKIIADMKTTMQVVETAHAIRAKASIKVRQPLSMLCYETSDKVQKLSDEFAAIIKDELNVKEVAAKQSIADLQQNSAYRVFENGPFKVALNIEITEELKQEGLFRDLVRQVQGMRKNALLTPSDVVTLSIETDDDGKRFVEAVKPHLMKIALLKDIAFKPVEGGDVLTVEKISLKAKLNK